MGRFVSTIFSCPDAPSSIVPTLSASSLGSLLSTVVPSSGITTANGQPTPSLAHLVAYALHRTCLHPSVAFTTLFLLQRLKARFPAARGSCGHRLFLSAFMLASEVIWDNTYSNKSRPGSLCALRDQAEGKRGYGYLEWRLNVASEEPKTFEKEVRRVFSKERRGYQWEIPTAASTTSTTPAPAPGPAVPEKEATTAKQRPTVKISDQAPVVITDKPQLPTPTNQPNGVAWPRHPSHAPAAPAMQQSNSLSSTVSNKSGHVYPLPPSTPPSPSTITSPVKDAPRYSTAVPAAGRHGSQSTHVYGSAAAPYTAPSSHGTAVLGGHSRRTSYQPYNYSPSQVFHTQPHTQNISPASSTSSSVTLSASTESLTLPTPPVATAPPTLCRTHTLTTPPRTQWPCTRRLTMRRPTHFEHRGVREHREREVKYMRGSFVSESSVSST